jgi:hypothetical protein
MGLGGQSHPDRFAAAFDDTASEWPGLRTLGERTNNALIDVYAATRTFGDPHTLARSLATQIAELQAQKPDG